MPEEYVICHLCQNQISNEEQSKLNHLFTHHSDIAKPLSSCSLYCVVCAATFPTAYHFLCHFHFSIKDGECPHCFKLFNEQILKQHIQIVHETLFNRHIAKTINHKNLEEDCASKTLLSSTTTDIDLDKLDLLLPWLTNVAGDKTKINHKVTRRTFMKLKLSDYILKKEKERRRKENSSKLKKIRAEKQRKKLVEIQID